MCASQVWPFLEIHAVCFNLTIWVKSYFVREMEIYYLCLKAFYNLFCLYRSFLVQNMKSTASKYSRLVMEWSWFAFFHQKPTPLRQDNDSTGLREHERLLCLNCAQTKMKFLLKPLSFFSHTCIKYRHMHNYAKLQFALPDTLTILSVFQEILNKILSGKNLPVLWWIQLFLPTALLELLLQKNRFVCFLVSVRSTIYEC